MEKYKDSFLELIFEGIADNVYIGIGNPNAKILFVGKEGSSEKNSAKEISFAEDWKKIINEGLPCFERYSQKFQEGHTWSKYQKLHDFIFPAIEKKLEDEINFGERIFATEMNINRAKRTKDALKDGMQERKNIFFRGEFVQQFPIVVLACGDYIKNNDYVREIDDIFKVEFDKEYSTVSTKKPYHFYTHYNDDKSKLVIHTRQLSGDVPNELLEKMGDVIRNFTKNKF